MKKSIKNIFIIPLLSSLLFIGNISAQEVTYTKSNFKVWGNCDMCKSKIEKAAKQVDGVKSAKWNVVSQKMFVKFNEKETSIDEIQATIAGTGYDTEKHKAKDEDYNNLHHCCKYDRE